MSVKRPAKKILVCFLSFLLIFVMAFSNTSIKTNAASAVSDLENKYSELEKQLKKLTKEMSATQNEKSQQLKYKQQIDKEISLVEQQIDNLNSQVKALNSQISDNQKLLDQKEDEIKENDELFKARLRAMYMMSDTSVWEVIFGSKSFAEFLKNAEYMKRLGENDRQLMGKLNVDKQQIVDARKIIEESKKKLEINKSTLNSKKSTLEQKYKQSQSLLNSLANEEASIKKQQQKINKEMEEIDEQIRQMLKNSGSQGEYVGGQFLWPLPGFSTITSYFGWRTLYGAKNWHTGIDISGGNVYGKAIVAANDGRVDVAVTTYVAGKGYGKYVIIDHGGDYKTLYGHCSSLAVKVGQTVKRGQTIAYVGSTGNSTGPHLHFGIYIEGKETDPLPYLK